MSALKRYIVTLCAVVCGTLSVAAQGSVEIRDVRFEPDSVLLGDHFDLVMEIVSRGDVALALPEIGADFAEGRIELLQDLGLDTLSVDEGGYRLRKRWRMTSFEPAMYSIDSLGLLWTDGSKVDTLIAPNALRLQVQMMPVDTAQKTIYDIKQPLKAPLKLGEVGGYTLLGLGVAAIVVGLVLLVLSRLRRRRQAIEERREPPHVVAIRHLEMLHNQKLWQNGRIKEYYTRLTEILREYLAGRYGVGAMEMTSDEIISAMKAAEVEPKHTANLGALLAESDLVKFAKYTPSEESHEEYYNMVYYFVEESKEIKEEVVAPEAQNIEGVVAEERKEEADE